MTYMNNPKEQSMEAYEQSIEELAAEWRASGGYGVCESCDAEADLDQNDCCEACDREALEDSA